MQKSFLIFVKQLILTSFPLIFLKKSILESPRSCLTKQLNEAFSLKFVIRLCWLVSKVTISWLQCSNLWIFFCLLDPNLRRDITSGAQILINYLRGRHIILSSGTDNFNLLRAPLDVQNLGKVLRLSNENALNAIRDNPLLLIQRSQARKNRYMSFQVQKSEEMTDMLVYTYI